MKKNVMVLIAVFMVTMGMNAFGADTRIKVLTGQTRLQDIYAKYAKKFEEKYNAANTQKIKMEVESYPADNYPTILKTKLSVGDAIDIFQIHAVNEMNMYVKTGYLADLTSTGIQKSLLPSMAKAVTVGGKAYGLPLETLLWGTLYNKDIFTKLGLKPADTLDEMKKNVDKLKAAGYTPFLISYKEQWIPQLFLPLTVGATSTTSKFVDNMYADKASFTSLKKQIFDVMDIVHANGNAKGLDIGGTDGCAEFASGKYGMWVQGPWFAETILDANKSANFGVAPLPVDNDKKHTMINQSVSTTFVVSKKSKNYKIATEFLKYILSDEITNEFFSELKFNPVAKNHTFKTYPWIDDAVKYVTAGRSYADPKIPQAVKDESGKVFQAYYGGGMNKEQVLESLDTAWKSFNKNQ